MSSMSPELVSLLEEFKSLPKKDRKAIERQMTGRDRLFVKNAVSEAAKPALLETDDVPVETQAANEHGLEVEAAEEEEEKIDLTMFPPWFEKRVEIILSASSDVSSTGVTQAVADILPECLDDKTGMVIPIKPSLKTQEDGRSFGTMLSRLRGGKV